MLYFLRPLRGTHPQKLHKFRSQDNGGGGQEVSIRTHYNDDPSLNPAVIEIIITTNKTKRGRIKLKFNQSCNYFWTWSSNQAGHCLSANQIAAWLKGCLSLCLSGARSQWQTNASRAFDFCVKFNIRYILNLLTIDKYWSLISTTVGSSKKIVIFL